MNLDETVGKIIEGNRRRMIFQFATKTVQAKTFSK
jgi:hypothetical protein